MLCGEVSGGVGAVDVGGGLLTSCAAYPAAFENEEPFPFFDGTEQKVSRPLSVPGSPRDRTGMMTPGDFPSLQEGMENLDTDDYVGWRLPSVTPESVVKLWAVTNVCTVRRKMPRITTSH